MVKRILKYKKRLCLTAATLLIFTVWGCSGQKSDSADSQVWGRADTKEIDINSKVAGRVVQLLVREGDAVKEGQAMAYIDKRDLMAQKNQLEANIKALEAQQRQASVQTSLTSGTSSATLDTAQASVKQAEADLGLAKSDYDRFSALVDSGAVSQQLFDTYKTKYETAQAAYAQAVANSNKANAGLLETDVDKANEDVLSKKIDQAKASLQQLEVQIDETTIRAPFDGIVTAKYIEEGSMISQGTPLVAVQDPTDNWVDIKVPETELAKFHLNQKLKLVARDNTTAVDGIVTDISQKAEFATARATSERGDSTDIISFNIKVQINSDKLRPGMRFKLAGDDES